MRAALLSAYPQAPPVSLKMSAFGTGGLLHGDCSARLITSLSNHHNISSLSGPLSLSPPSEKSRLTDSCDEGAHGQNKTQTASLPLPVFQMPLLDGLQQQASWRTTYLDDEWRVGRGEPSDAVFLFKRQTQEQAEAEAAAAAAAVDGGAYLHPPMDALAGLLWV